MKTSVKVGQGQTVVSEMPLSETRLDCSALAGSTAPQADPVYKWRQDVGLKDPQQEVTRYKQRAHTGLQDSEQQRTGDASDTDWSADDIVMERRDTQMLATSCDSTHLQRKTSLTADSHGRHSSAYGPSRGGEVCNT